MKRMILVLTGLVVLLFAAACGSQADKYEGTWVQSAQGAQQQAQMPQIVVKKVGDQYAFTDPSGQTKLVAIQADPSGIPGSNFIRVRAIELSDNTLATHDGDSLKLVSHNDTFTITADGSTMTWVTPSEDAPFTFTRATTATTG